MPFQKISIDTPQTERLKISWGGWRRVCKTKTFKEMYKASLEFPEGWGLEKIPSMGEVSIFSGTIDFASSSV